MSAHHAGRETEPREEEEQLRGGSVNTAVVMNRIAHVFRPLDGDEIPITMKASGARWELIVDREARKRRIQENSLPNDRSICKKNINISIAAREPLSSLSSLPSPSLSLCAAAAADEFHGGEGRPAAVEVDPSWQFPSRRLRDAYVALQTWKLQAIFSDPYNFTADWVGPDGVYCGPLPSDPRAVAVAGVDLNHGDIAGFLPPELGLLADLALLHLNSNRFCGVLPPTLRRLRLLHELDLSNNRFVGAFPELVLHPRPSAGSTAAARAKPPLLLLPCRRERAKRAGGSAPRRVGSPPRPPPPHPPSRRSSSSARSSSPPPPRRPLRATLEARWAPRSIADVLGER
ncbi:hypothetical protein EJB05_17578, partial [Eragrostis curvula]